MSGSAPTVTTASSSPLVLKNATLPLAVFGAGLDRNRHDSVSHRDAVDNGAVRIDIDLIDLGRIRRVGDADDIDRCCGRRW